MKCIIAIIMAILLLAAAVIHYSRALLQRPAVTPPFILQMNGGVTANDTCFLTLGSALCQSDAILRNDFDGPQADGSYKWAIQTQGGIYHEQRRTPKGNSALVEGQYQYIAPDGQVIHVLYTADETGFHASGAHLPTPPPVPPQIQRALDFIARLNAKRP